MDADNNGNTGDAGAMWTVGETYQNPTYGILVSVDAQVPTGFTVTATNNSGFIPTPTPTLVLTPTPTPTPTRVPGDANGDRKVDESDYAIWFSHYTLQTVNGSADGDLNKDGVVDGADYVIWLTHYGT